MNGFKFELKYLARFRVMYTNSKSDNIKVFMSLYAQQSMFTMWTVVSQ